MVICWNFSCAHKKAQSNLDNIQDLISRNEQAAIRVVLHQTDLIIQEADLLKRTRQEEKSVAELRQRRAELYSQLDWHQRFIFRATIIIEWLRKHLVSK